MRMIISFGGSPLLGRGVVDANIVCFQ
jgi:hypothetical protein